MSFTVTGGGGLTVVVSLRGGRITSLTSAGEREWLAPSTPPTSGAFVQPGMGGWDELLPTVRAVTLSDGTRLPDHGDLWSSVWHPEEVTDSRIDLSAFSPSASLTLRRLIEVTDTGLRLSYRATSTSATPVPLFWSAHPQFVASDTAVLRLFSGRSEVFPALLEEYPAPGAERPFEAQSLAWWAPLRTSVKVFAAPTERVDSATIGVPGSPALQLSWNRDELPYLGLFWDNREFAAQPVICLEPTTAHGDSAADAAALGRVLLVSAAQPVTWQLELALVDVR